MRDEQMINDLEFEQQISEMHDHDLLVFMARHCHQTDRRCTMHEQRLSKLEKERGLGPKIIAGIGAAVGGAVAGIIYGVISLARK